jgi:RNA polymerase sigma-70 factor (ECF subfamily)
MKQSDINMDVVHQWSESSLQLLYRHFYKALVAFSHQMVEKQEIAEELVQDVFVTLWQRRNFFKNEGVLKAYLYNSVRNRSISYLRHERVERNRFESFGLDYQLMTGSDDASYREDLIRQLLLSIESLTPKQREIFLLSIKGKTCKEIAIEMNVSSDAVKKLRQRGLKRLRESLSPELLLFLFIMMK